MLFQTALQLVSITSLLTQIQTTSAAVRAKRSDNPLDAHSTTATTAPIHVSLVEKRATSSIGKRSTASEIPLMDDINSSQFGIEVQIGTPPQNFVLMLDTGSTDTWVSSSECTVKDGCPDFMQHFLPQNSSTYRSVLNDDRENEHNHEMPIDIVYGIGHAEGRYFEDVLTLTTKSMLKNDFQRLVLVHKTEGPLSHQQHKSEKDEADITLDGVFAAGLTTTTTRATLSSNTTTEEERQRLHSTSSTTDPMTNHPFFISLYNSNSIPEPMFSVALAEGSLILGAKHSSNHSYVYTDVASVETRWDANVYKFQFENASRAVNFNFNEPTPVGVDTGSNFLYLPEVLAYDLAAAVSHNTYKKPTDERPYFLIDCEYQSSHQFVNIYFLPSSSASFTGRQRIDNEVGMKISVKHLIAQRESDGQCLLLFVPSKDKFIIGNMILRHFYTVFDFGEVPKIGFAPYYRTE
ncbi:aspartic peptidase domain-containing protein [Mycotypha africana]|uniref:aspartic peptidase domain-containing protein n=1 Tax=Mycotypha africana TaxID=64632 RepID=UPI0022FFF745|nr:aspartic peptidase domain-containing protein [Mycotypha africana]KAI8988019.1 aspartic peptidase domain-containing protein [Mycotypha africana]